MVKWAPVLQNLRKQETNDTDNANALTNWLDALCNSPSQFEDPTPPREVKHSRPPLKATSGNLLANAPSRCSTLPRRGRKKGLYRLNNCVSHPSGEDLPPLPTSPSRTPTRHRQHNPSAYPPSLQTHTSSRQLRPRPSFTSPRNGPAPSFKLPYKRKMSSPTKKDREQRSTVNIKLWKYRDEEPSKEQENNPKTPRGKSPQKRQPRTPAERAVVPSFPQPSRNPTDLQDPFITPGLASGSSQQDRGQSQRNESPTKKSSTKSSFSLDRVSWMATDISPPVKFMTVEDSKDLRLPPHLSVQHLWTNYLRHPPTSIIPMELKNRISEHEDTPHKSKVPIAPYRYASTTSGGYPHYRPSDIEMLWAGVLDVVSSAGQYRNTRCTEAHWMARVVHPLLSIVRRLQNFKSNGFELLEVADMTTVKINKKYCPKKLNKDGEEVEDEDKSKDKSKIIKQIDGAVGLRLTQQEIETLEAAEFRDGTYGINAVEGDFMNLTPLWNHIEVKRPYTDKDPGVQLGVWSSAEFSKREFEGIDMNMPTISTRIEGDNWLMHITYPVVVEGGFQRTVSLGPTPIGDTLTMDGIFTILYYYCMAATWALNEYRTWFRRAIMEYYGHNYAQT